jgi:hypothetical protein
MTRASSALAAESGKSGMLFHGMAGRRGAGKVIGAVAAANLTAIYRRSSVIGGVSLGPFIRSTL